MIISKIQYFLKKINLFINKNKNTDGEEEKEIIITEEEEEEEINSTNQIKSSGTSRIIPENEVLVYT